MSQMYIKLTEEQIKQSLDGIHKGLQQYQSLQHRIKISKNRLLFDLQFRTDFNAFYRVRRNGKWQDSFYSLLDAYRNKLASFQKVFQALLETTGRFETSFASKLLASIDPSMPVIDSIVLRNVNGRIPRFGIADRFSKICQLHCELGNCYTAYLKSDEGRRLVQFFDQYYPEAGINNIKKLDFVLWQHRPANGRLKAKR